MWRSPLKERLGYSRDPEYGHVEKAIYNLPVCGCGEEINPPRGPRGQPYKMCITCMRRGGAGHGHKKKIYMRRLWEVRALGGGR